MNKDARIIKMAQTIIHYSTSVQAGDVVFIRGLSPLAEPLMQALYQEALKTGAYAFPYMHLSMEDALAIESTDDLNLLSEPNPMLMRMYEQADVIIGIHAAENIRSLSNYPADKQQARSQANYAPIKIQKARHVRRCTTQFPTQAYAQAAGMSLTQYSDFLFRACKVHLDDPVAAWHALHDEQAQFITFLQDKKHIHVKGENIDLQMSIEGRRFINSAGKANFPDGEIFTSPVEDSVNGWVKFSYPAIYNGVEVDGIALEFKDGVVVEASAQKNEAFLLEILNTDAGARRLGEFAIGTNTDIQQFTGAILFDEKIGGTIHMSLGQGFALVGGKNQSSIHWDMVYDMRNGGEIMIDGGLVYRDGVFL